MIELTRLNGNPLFVNGDQIKWAEAAPDTMLTLMSGEKVVVRESCSEVVERMIAFRVRLLRAAAEFVPVAVMAAGALHAAPPSVMGRSPEDGDSAEVVE
jgi:flagellar protein FlbD